MEAVQEKVMVPHTVQKPVTRKVARERIEYESETHVRPVSTQYTTYKSEVVTEDVVIKTPIMERIVQKVQVPERIARSVPYTEMKTVARTYTTRVPIYPDGTVIGPASVPIVDGGVVTAGGSNQGTASQASGTSTPATSGSGDVTSKKPAVAEEAELPSPKKDPKNDKPEPEAAKEEGLSIGPADGGSAAPTETAAKKPAERIKLKDDE
jgi:hypothetical protein